MNEHTQEYLRAEARLDAIGFALVARLEGGMRDFPHDISERLKVARLRAVERRKLTVRQMAPAVVRSGTTAALTSGDDDGGVWRRWVAVVPLLALAAGLLAISIVQSDNRVNELAEIDAALLTDDLPPAAYADPGFVQFVKWSRDHGQ
ncbi:MAG: DUF3619 family protein [Burkholderiales bacterium]